MRTCCGGMAVEVMQEFVSAVTPSSVGGSSFIFLYLNREGLSGGRSTTVMLLSLFLDELFICLGCVLVVLAYPFDALFGSASIVMTGVRWVFFAVLPGIAAWTAGVFPILCFIKLNLSRNPLPFGIFCLYLQPN